jgi:hypothetical protein
VGSPADSLFGAFRGLGQKLQNGVDFADGDTLRRNLSGMLHIPQISPDYETPTPWHGEMVDAANKSFADAQARQQGTQAAPAPLPPRRRLPPKATYAIR